MKKITSLLFYVIFITLSTFAQLRVTVIEDSLYSKSVNSYMRFNIILPPDYFLNEERYTTLYLLHGYSGNQDDWITRTGLVSYAKESNIIIVTPDGKNSWYTNSPVVKNKNFEDYIIKDLIPFVDKKYRTLATRHGRAITGLSMGGYGSIKLALKFPGMFFFAGSFSGAMQYPGVIEEMIKTNKIRGLGPSLIEAFGETKNEGWTKNDVMLLVDSVSLQNIPYFYISVGKDDWADLVKSNLDLVAKMRNRKILYEYHELPGVHNWIFWDKEIAVFLKKLVQYDPLRP